MTLLSRISSRLWIAVLICACAFLIRTDYSRIERINYVSGLGGRAESVDLIDAASPTGYANGQRELIIAEHHHESYEWLAQTQQMFARHEARVRHVDYDNAPYGREVNSPSLYRWWLGGVAWVHHAISGQPIGLSVEAAALYADPALQLLFVIITAVVVAWQFGSLAALLFSMGAVGLFPFAVGFLPGAPDDQGWVGICALWSVLPLILGLRDTGSLPQKTGVDEKTNLEGKRETRARREHRWFFFSGVMGGLGLWSSVAYQVPILVGIALGGIVSAVVARTRPPAKPVGWIDPMLWRTWGWSGAAATLVAYLIEYFPAHLGSWQLRAIHPLYGLAWLGGSELLAQAAELISGEKRWWSLRRVLVIALAAGAVAALPITLWRISDAGFLAVVPATLRLTRLFDDVSFTHLGAWLSQTGPSLKAWTTLLPVMLILPAAWLLWSRTTNKAARTSVALALGPVLVALGFACRELSWWNLFDGMLLGLLVAGSSPIADLAKSTVARCLGLVSVIVLLGLGAVTALRPSGEGRGTALSEPELKGLVERDLAHWVTKRAGPRGAVVLAPPNETTTLFYYGGARGVGTLSWENQDGLKAAIRTVSATTKEEAQALIEGRGITHIIIPSWDHYLDEYARLGVGQVEGTFLSGLHRWVLPPWLRPVPYQLPTIAGFEGQSVAIFEVVDEQDEPTLLSRLAEYFIEMGQLDLAASLAEALRRFPADLGASVARAEVEMARGDEAGLAASFKVLLPRLTAGTDRNLAWERRVGLAVVLARGKHVDLAREQVRRSLAEVNEARLRGLSTEALYRLQVLAKAFGLQIADPLLRELALKLLPTELRSRL